MSINQSRDVLVLEKMQPLLQPRERQKHSSSLVLQVVFCIAVGAKGDEEVLAPVLVQCFGEDEHIGSTATKLSVSRMAKGQRTLMRIECKADKMWRADVSVPVDRR
ncbi:hypothetical protein IG631_08700 [Alternaria alternata]|nr:hypothetical protein IG631_08700 [Alternaria alternata]